MINIWLLRKESRDSYPIGFRIKVTGPFDIMNDQFNQYIGEYGTVVDHMFEEFTYSSGNFWIGVVLDVNKYAKGNNTNWFSPLEIEWSYEDYVLL